MENSSVFIVSEYIRFSQCSATPKKSIPFQCSVILANGGKSFGNRLEGESQHKFLAVCQGLFKRTWLSLHSKVSGSVNWFKSGTG